MTTRDQTHDSNGRPWAKLSEIKPGDKLQADGGFTCIPEEAIQVVKSGPDGLYVNCVSEKHLLSSQVSEENGDSLIGLYKVEG